MVEVVQMTKRLLIGFSYLISFLGMLYFWVQERFWIAAVFGVCVACLAMVVRSWRRPDPPATLPLFWWIIVWVWFFLVMFWFYPREIVREEGLILFFVLALILEIWEGMRAKKMKRNGNPV